MPKEAVKTEPTLADVLAAVGAIGTRVDAIGARVDSMEKKDDESEEEKAKRDAEEKAKKDAEEAKAKKDGEDTPAASREDSARKDGESDEDWKKRSDAMKADAEEKARKDAEEKAKKDAEGCAEKVAADARRDAEEAKKDAAAARADLSTATKRIAAIEAKLPQDRSDDDHRTMSTAQARADSVYELFGKQAPRFLSGETSGEYRRRLVRAFAEHSPQWKTVDVGALPDSAFAVAEEQIYADAASAAKDAVGVEDGGLRMVQGTTSSGHKKVEFFGRPSAWMGRFGGARRYATSIRPNTSKREAV